MNPILGAERDVVRSEAEACRRPPTVLRLQAALAADDLTAVDRGDEALNYDIADGETESRDALGRLVQQVVRLSPESRATAIQVTGRLARFVEAGADRFGPGIGGRMVAGEGLEPPTRGL